MPWPKTSWAPRPDSASHRHPSRRGWCDELGHDRWARALAVCLPDRAEPELAPEGWALDAWCTDRCAFLRPGMRPPAARVGAGAAGPVVRPFVPPCSAPALKAGCASAGALGTHCNESVQGRRCSIAPMRHCGLCISRIAFYETNGFLCLANGLQRPLFRLLRWGPLSRRPEFRLNDIQQLWEAVNLGASAAAIAQHC